jgi:FtsZ-interacting cell division protein ZipA
LQDTLQSLSHLRTLYFLDNLRSTSQNDGYQEPHDRFITSTIRAQRLESISSYAFEQVPHLNIVGVGRRRRPTKQVKAPSQQAQVAGPSNQHQTQQQRQQTQHQQHPQHHHQAPRPVANHMDPRINAQRQAQAQQRHVHGPQRQQQAPPQPVYFMRSLRRDLDGRETVMATEVTDFERIRNVEEESDILDVVADSNRLVKGRCLLGMAGQSPR